MNKAHFIPVFEQNNVLRIDPELLGVGFRRLLAPFPTNKTLVLLCEREARAGGVIKA